MSNPSGPSAFLDYIAKIDCVISSNVKCEMSKFSAQLGGMIIDVLNKVFASIAVKGFHC